MVEAVSLLGFVALVLFIVLMFSSRFREELEDRGISPNKAAMVFATIIAFKSLLFALSGLGNMLTWIVAFLWIFIAHRYYQSYKAE